MICMIDQLTLIELHHVQAVASAQLVLWTPVESTY